MSAPGAGLRVVPVSSKDAKEFCALWHRHHGPPPGTVYSMGVADSSNVLRGVAITGRPVARHFDDGQTLEVTRVVTDGAMNACSMLYGAAWRAAKALGYRRLITYTQGDETGASLRGAGWRVIGTRRPRTGWSCVSRPRTDRGADGVPRILWEAC